MANPRTNPELDAALAALLDRKEPPSLAETVARHALTIMRLRAALETIAKRIDDMPLRPRNDYEAGEKNAYQWCADHALAALEK